MSKPIQDELTKGMQLWHNYKTGRQEAHYSVPPDKNAWQYVPPAKQVPGAQRLFAEEVESGTKPIQAARNTLEDLSVAYGVRNPKTKMRMKM